jgi:hypothetical protein
MRIIYVLLTFAPAGLLMTVVPHLVDTVSILDVRVHRVGHTGNTEDSWIIFSPHKIRPLLIPAWTANSYSVGNVRIDVRIRNDGRRTLSLRFDTQTFGRETHSVGKRISTDSQLVQPGKQRVFVH